jgi:hypothetical protein
LLIGHLQKAQTGQKKKYNNKKKILAAQIKKNKTWVERIYQRALVWFLSCQLCPLPAKLVIHLFVKSKKRKRRRIKRKLFVSFSFYTFIVKHVLISLYSLKKNVVINNKYIIIIIIIITTILDKVSNSVFYSLGEYAV